MKTVYRILGVALSLAVMTFPAALVIVGCGGKKSKTTNTNSSAFSTLRDKQAFLEQYVTFDRTYEILEFNISYIDGGDGRVPGPTEWDIRVSAKVPAASINDWISGMTQSKPSDTSWVSSIPNAPAKLDAFQWYEDGRTLVGISPEERMVLYRHFAN